LVGVGQVMPCPCRAVHFRHDNHGSYKTEASTLTTLPLYRHGFAFDSVHSLSARCKEHSAASFPRHAERRPRIQSRRRHHAFAALPRLPRTLSPEACFTPTACIRQAVFSICRRTKDVSPYPRYRQRPVCREAGPPDPEPAHRRRRRSHGHFHLAARLVAPARDSNRRQEPGSCATCLHRKRRLPRLPVPDGSDRPGERAACRTRHGLRGRQGREDSRGRAKPGVAQWEHR
jgi:hypothetical protein